MSVSQALFGSSSARGQNKNLVEFKAGKMTMKGKMVHADKRKGLVYVYQSEDSLMHFCWKDRSTGSVEDDLIIFPEDVEFKKVPECTTGRVYLLKFKSSTRKLFFWLQEPKTEKDDEYCRKVNDFLNNPPNQRSGGGTPEGDIQNLLSNMSQQQLLQFFGGVGQISGLSSLLGTMGPRSGSGSGSNNSSGTAANSGAAVASSGGAAASPGPTGAAAAKTPSTPVGQSIPKATTPAAPAKSNTGSNVDAEAKNAVRLSQLQNFLASNFDSQGQPTTAGGVDLSTSLNQESLQALLNNPSVVRELQKHLPALGDGNDQESLRATLASPQFQQALSMFSSALQSGQLGPVVSQFEVGADAVSAANQGNMEDFVRALQAAKISSSSATSPSGGGGSGNQEASGAGNEEEPSQEEKKVKRDTEEEDMNLD